MGKKQLVGVAAIDQVQEYPKRSLIKFGSLVPQGVKLHVRAALEYLKMIVLEQTQGMVTVADDHALRIDTFVFEDVKFG